MRTGDAIRWHHHHTECAGRDEGLTATPIGIGQDSSLLPAGIHTWSSLSCQLDSVAFHPPYAFAGFTMLEAETPPLPAAGCTAFEERDTCQLLIMFGIRCPSCLSHAISRHQYAVGRLGIACVAVVDVSSG